MGLHLHCKFFSDSFGVELWLFNMCEGGRRHELWEEFLMFRGLLMYISQIPRCLCFMCVCVCVCSVRAQKASEDSISVYSVVWAVRAPACLFIYYEC